ncbi:hypothetical protein Q3S85_000677 [Vibrio cholerae]
MAYGFRFITGNGRTYDLTEIGVGVYLGQIAKSGVGSVSQSFQSLVGNAVTIVACNNGGSTRPANGYSSSVTVNPSTMQVTLNVFATGGYQAGTPVFYYDLYAKYA